MKHITIIILALLLAACSKDSAPPPASNAGAPTPVLEQEKEIAAKLAEQKATAETEYRNQLANQKLREQRDLMMNAIGKWNTLRASAEGKKRSEMGAVVAAYEQARTEWAAAELAGCADEVRQMLLQSADRFIAAFKAIQAGSADRTAAEKKSIEDALVPGFSAEEKAKSCNV